MGWRLRAREWGVWRGTTESILKEPLIECFGQMKKIGTTVLRQSWTSFSLVVKALIDFHVPLGDVSWFGGPRGCR